MQAKRINGLDTLRALAILLVLMSHYCGFVSKRQTFGFAGDIGWAGVDLFFVLSGYLIGNQIMSAAAYGQALSLKNFFARRLLRTLPNYYVVLAAYFIFPVALSGRSTSSLWQFLTFTQNIGLEYGQTFTHSWSLCIEEQFYLILPIVSVILVRLKSPIWLAWGLLIAAIGGGMAFRAVAYMHGHDAFDAEVYYSSFGRFDELLPGVAIAMLKNFHTSLYDRLMRHGQALLITGLLAAGGTLYCINSDDYNELMIVNSLGFSLIAISFAILTLAALSPNSYLHRLRLPGAAQLALWSYAVYLVHKPVFMLIGEQLAKRHINANAPLTIVLVTAAGIFGGWLLYRLVETPFMRIREKWFPGPNQRAQIN
ncbi:acyltransferase family protein [Undibacterium umbellatum]|uniref:Acyltransferase n=1 Tax=Undibacterium umbellatum TaxID=2762300 RepID=A0ABR6ZE00_9BURK|nr:acyltransferase [Undibacterium umbellatum]MBC3909964.1 acyltransferase [Undibacterium umbellatum]